MVEEVRDQNWENGTCSIHLRIVMYIIYNDCMRARVTHGVAKKGECWAKKEIKIYGIITRIKVYTFNTYPKLILDEY